MSYEARYRRALEYILQIVTYRNGRTLYHLADDVGEAARLALRRRRPGEKGPRQFAVRPWVRDERLVLSVRATHVIERALALAAGYASVRDEPTHGMARVQWERKQARWRAESVAALTVTEMMKVRGAGEKTVREVAAALEKLGLRFKHERTMGEAEIAWR